MNTTEYILKYFDKIIENKQKTTKIDPPDNDYKNHCASYNCINGLIKYLNSEFEESLQNFEDAGLILSSDAIAEEKILYEFLLGYINYNEKNKIFMLHYNNAKRFAEKENKDEFLRQVIEKINNLKNGNGYTTAAKKDPLLALVKIGQAVAAEKNIDKLIKTIAEETKEALQADRCTVFLYDKDNDELWSKVALGLGSTELRFKSNQGLAGHVFQSGETINIKDAYSDSRFNKNIDKETGYRTKTILCMPIKNIDQEIIGVFQILNKITGYFTKEDEDLLVTIGSSAGISLENATLFARQGELIKEQQVVFDSFISTLAASIDARDKITSGHSTRVRMYSSLIAEAFELPDNERELIQKAAVLHDIGKIGIRDSVLQKEGKLTPEEYKHIQEHVEITHNILEKIHMSDEFKQITEIACTHHEKYDGTGYYRQLKGEEIPFGGRILAVSDVFDAITSKRHYRDKMPIVKVIDILISDSGTHFDSCVIDKFLSIKLNKITEVFLTENHLLLNDQDKLYLSQYTLLDLFNTINKNSNEKLINKFNFYYTGITIDAVQV